MKRLIFFFLLLLGAVWVGLKIHKDPGYVLITYQHWSLETTLWFALLFFLLLFLLIFLLLKTFRKTVNLPGKVRGFFSQRHLRKANKQTYEGLCQLVEGEWKSAEKTLMQGVDLSYVPLVNYLAAAIAAQQQGHYENRDDHLRQAYQTDPEAEIAIGLTQAQLQINAKQWELALATLSRLEQLAPNHKFILKLLCRVYLELKEWQNLQGLLPKLKKYKIFNSKEFDELEKTVYLALLSNAIATNNSELIEKTWNDIPSRLQLDQELLSIYTDHLIRTNRTDQAETLLRQALKKQWVPELVTRFGKAKGENISTQEQLATAEDWLKEHGSDPTLLLCLARLSVRDQQWEKAKNYLKSCLQMDPSPEAYYELGQVYEKLNDPQAAIDCYRRGILAPHVC